MIRLKIYFFLILSVTSYSQPFIQDVKHFIWTGKNVITSPLEWDSKDWINLGGTLAFTVAGYAFDTQVENLALRNRSSFNDGLFTADKIYFIPAGAAAMGSLYIYGIIAEDKEIRHLGLQLGEATAYAGLVTIAIKTIIGRSRPFVQKGKKEANFFRTQDAQTSFPSGHSTFAFAFSTVMANYIDNVYWKVSWYTAAGLVGAARIYHDKHWFSDVIFGAAVGHFVADYVVHGSEEKNKIELGLLPSGLFLRVAL